MHKVKPWSTVVLAHNYNLFTQYCYNIKTQLVSPFVQNNAAQTE